MKRGVICTCEDVTASDVHHAIERGYTDIESIKRYTGFGTGMCQGKVCMGAVARILAASGKRPASAIQAFTARTPLYPTELSVLGAMSIEPDAAPYPGTPPGLDSPTPELRSPEPLPGRAKIVIIGGGIMGLALAHNLGRRGVTDVVVLERGYLLAGASGRNGGGVRMQWGTATNVALAKRSIELMKGFAREMGINVWLRQGGYLFLAQSQKVAKQLEASTKLHNQHGVRTQLLTPDGAQELVPELSLKDTQVCAWNPDDGVIFPWPFLWGYAQSCQKRGIRVETYTDVVGFEQDATSGLIRKVKTDRGDIECDTVVLAAGAWSPEVAARAGVKLPNEPHRHEICSTEPLKPFLGPLVSVLDSGLYFSQSMRGEIVGGMGDPQEPPGLHMGSTLRFLARYGRALTERMPKVGRIKVLRQWAGCYDVTPDNSPILGRTPGVENLLQMSGFVGHGFMMAPAVAERMAAWMTEKDNADELFSRFNLQRFAEGRLEKENMIIG